MPPLPIAGSTSATTGGGVSVEIDVCVGRGLLVGDGVGVLVGVGVGVPVGIGVLIGDGKAVDVAGA
jgi:hypothetical protein